MFEPCKKSDNNFIRKLRVRAMVFNTTFNNISLISWQSVLLVEETRVPGENHQPVASHWQTLSHNVVSSRPHMSRIRIHKVSGDSHYHTITTTNRIWEKYMLFLLNLHERGPCKMYNLRIKVGNVQMVYKESMKIEFKHGKKDLIIIDILNIT
jgi:hypothetical protein